MTEQKNDRGLSVGLSSLAVIFTVIVMTIFAVLAYSTADGDARMAEKYARSVAAWWEADSAAEEITAALREAWSEEPDSLEETARALGCEHRLTDRGTEISFRIPVDGARELSVRLEAGEGFTVAAWQTAPAEETWQPDSELELHRG